jgi:hypothetical protein
MKRLAKLIQRLPIGCLITLKISNDIKKNMNFKNYCNFAFKELFMFLCNFCELFLLIFILSYVFYESIWFIFLIIAGILGYYFNFNDFDK